MSSPTSLYRSLLRELRKSAVTPRPSRSKAIISHLRLLFTSESLTPQEREKDAQNTLTFLRSQRTHKDLLQRYNPLSDLTPEERVRATARRVGLDTPVEHVEPSKAEHS
ncbi:hypothetical protein CALVIDRAFT_538034 [Calocera viscosa TUFC12733]|uniref:Uncharacterized protein n=1 Tax=Calocera viscosa (strain TUFC12733) TaxID=1330018 RepID=A0A167LFH7_CALVF|nr:hypothetical protein CALVIDRAFT_538034 [Calocera viscosa TUFC12733]